MGRTYIDRERLEVVGYQGVPEGYENTFDCGVMWLLEQIDEMPSAEVVEVVRCKDCIHFDPPHVEKEGVRYEYKDMPSDAFDLFGIGVHSGYGINFGGRCCVDDYHSYAEDKRVFVSEMNYCGRGVRKDG